MNQNTGTTSGWGWMTRRGHLRAVAGVGATAALAGCGASGATEQTAAPAKTPVTINYMSQLVETHPDGAMRLELIDSFNRTNELGITVNTAEGKAATNMDKIKALAAGGSPPDLYYQPYNLAAELFVTGITVDVDAELKGDKEWAKQRADIFPNMLETSTWNGKLVAMPGHTNNQALVYNLGLLQRDGVAPPKQNWTWNDFRATAERFIRPDVIPFSVNWDDWDHFLGTTGSRPVNKDGRKVTIDTPEMLATMEFMVGLYTRGIAQLTPDGKSVAEQYRNAKNDTVFELQGAYRFPTYRQNNAPPWGAIHTPIHPQGGQLFGYAAGQSPVVMNMAPEKRRAAAQVARWITAPKQQAQHCIKANAIPVSKAVMSDKDFQDYLAKDPAYKVFIDLAPNNWRWPLMPSYAKINGAIDTHVGAILRREVSISAGLANAQREGQLALDEDVKLMK
jgi:multiple sugar transport system substrate-binding protein